MSKIFTTKLAASLLLEMLSIESTSGKEKERADFLEKTISKYNDLCSFQLKRIENNIVLLPTNFISDVPTLMLTSHIDTVVPVKDYSFDPLNAFEKDGTIYGLGSNDDGGCVVSQLMVTLNYYKEIKEGKPQNLNLILDLGAEEEKSGSLGMDLVLSQFKQWDNDKNTDFIYPTMAIMGEPTGMNVACGERGLLVLDCYAEGISGHAAREEGVNALYKAIDDINLLRNYNFEKVSPSMGKVKLTTTILNSGSVHNVVPGDAKFTIDIRPTDKYTNTEIYEIIKNLISSKVVPRNLTNKSSATPAEHILLKIGRELGLEEYVSPTTSDWMRTDIPAIKMGPGESCRSHKADEFIHISEIEQGINVYSKFLQKIN